MKRMRRGSIIGLTGGIGSGKTTATAHLRALGANTLDADAISRALLEPDGGCYRAVLDAFGTEILRADGSIDRRKLGGIVFCDEAARERLNAIVHPAVCEALLAEARAILESDPAAVVVLDVPLLFECGLYRQTDENVLIYADDAVRLARIVARDGCAEEAALRRMAAQMPQEEKRMLADVVIDNSGTREALYAQLESWYGA